VQPNPNLVLAGANGGCQNNARELERKVHQKKKSSREDESTKPIQF